MSQSCFCLKHSQMMMMIRRFTKPDTTPVHNRDFQERRKSDMITDLRSQRVYPDKAPPPLAPSPQGQNNI